MASPEGGGKRYVSPTMCAARSLHRSLLGSGRRETFNSSRNAALVGRRPPILNCPQLSSIKLMCKCRGPHSLIELPLIGECRTFSFSTCINPRLHGSSFLAPYRRLWTQGSNATVPHKSNYFRLRLLLCGSVAAASLQNWP